MREDFANRDIITKALRKSIKKRCFLKKGGKYLIIIEILAFEFLNS